MDVKPRKLPLQERSRATVDAIIVATTQLLLEQGYDNLTTAQVAVRAGVSVGSLYQYFPNKAALATALVERCCTDFEAMLDRALGGADRRSLDDSVKSLVDAAFVSHHLPPDLHRLVMDLAPSVGASEKVARTSRMATERVEGMLRAHADELAPGLSMPEAAGVVETMLETLSHRAVRSWPDGQNPAIMANEAARLVLCYLKGATP